MKFAAWVAKNELARRNIDPKTFDTGVFGMTNNQYQSFYGAPWPLYEIGATHTPGHMITQVCATGARVVFAGASEIQLGLASQAIVIAADRCSNGPHIYYPAPKGPGGYGQSEDQVTYNMMNDAIGGHSMLKTAENVARKFQISKEENDEVTLRRYEQYQDALADDHAFQKRYMTLPFNVPKHNFKGEDGVMQGDEGVFETTKEGLARLEAGDAGRHRHLRQPDPPGRRQCGHHPDHAGEGPRAFQRSVYPGHDPRRRPVARRPRVHA
ncbi:hypothetical protein LRS04_16955 [Phenylobacterium sp. J367]|nr:hypothetical protein [Phenylobacterium sp. J367]